MANRLLRRAPTLFVSLHCVLWGIVMLVWVFAWRVEPAPRWPRFNFAKQFIDRIDCVGSAIAQVLSLNLGREVTKRFGNDLGLNFTVLYGILILLAGTLQWFALGRLTRWVTDEYGEIYAALLCLGLTAGILLAFISWAFSW